MNTRQTLFRADSPVASIFGVHGTDENDLSGAFAFALSISEPLRRVILEHLGLPKTVAETPASIHVQTARRNEGITDVEIRIPGSAFVVFEAKVGSHLPSVRQLAQYARLCRRLRYKASCIVTLTSHDEASAVRPIAWRALRTPIYMRSWSWLAHVVRTASSAERQPSVKFVLRELLALLEEFVGFERALSNLVYVVSLGSGHPRNWELSWVDIVEKHRRYFYAFGAKSWPAPPNYIGFRYKGRLQSIHHVDRFEVVTDVRRHFPGASRGPKWGARYLLHLGPPMRPPRVVKTGDRIFRNARVWCMLDALLTSKTVSKALEITKRRRKKAQLAA